MSISISEKISRFQTGIISYKVVGEAIQNTRVSIRNFREGMLSHIARKLYVENHYNLYEIEQLEKAVRLLTTPIKYEDMQNIINMNRGHLRGVIDVLRKEKEEDRLFQFYQVTKEEQFNYIKEFIKSTSARILVRPELVMKIPMDNFTLKHGAIEEEFSGMSICIVPRKMPTLFVDGPIKRNNYIHPHADYGDIFIKREICTGDSTQAIKSALRRMDLYSVVDIITSVLHTYNPDSPFITLEKLAGLDQCPNCENYTDEIRACAFCGRDICPECTDGTINNIHYCSRCFPVMDLKQICNSCNKRESTLGQCVLCAKKVCNECSHNYTNSDLFDTPNITVCTNCNPRYEELSQKYSNK